MKRGFTLIELLVVTMILGILAAIALPMYWKSLERSKTSEAFAFLDSLKKHQAMVKLTYGDYTTSFNYFIPDYPKITLTGENTADSEHYTYSLHDTYALAAARGRYDYTIRGDYAGNICIYGPDADIVVAVYDKCGETGGGGTEPEPELVCTWTLVSTSSAAVSNSSACGANTLPPNPCPGAGVGFTKKTFKLAGIISGTCTSDIYTCVCQ